MISLAIKNVTVVMSGMYAYLGVETRESVLFFRKFVTAVQY